LKKAASRQGIIYSLVKPITLSSVIIYSLCSIPWTMGLSGSACYCCCY